MALTEGPIIASDLTDRTRRRTDPAPALLSATLVEGDAPPETGRHRLVEPGREGTLRDLARHRYLLALLVRKEVRLKYATSSLGYFWSYVRPTLQFLAYVLIIGQVLGMSRAVNNFPVFIFSGLTIILFFNDTVNQATKSLVRNKSIIKKVYVPRELFPMACLFVALTRFFATLTILLVGATVTGSGFKITALGIAQALAGFIIAVMLAFGVGLLFSALYVFLRELEHIRELMAFLVHWAVPLIHPWTLVHGKFENSYQWVFTIYIWNPLTTAIELFHEAFWKPTVDYYYPTSPDLLPRTFFALGFGVILIVVAQMVFVRLRDRFAEEL